MSATDISKRGLGELRETYAVSIWWTEMEYMCNDEDYSATELRI
jgi:hypothetical protein